VYPVITQPFHAHGAARRQRHEVLTRASHTHHPDPVSPLAVAHSGRLGAAGVPGDHPAVPPGAAAASRVSGGPHRRHRRSTVLQAVVPHVRRSRRSARVAEQMRPLLPCAAHGRGREGRPCIGTTCWSATSASSPDSTSRLSASSASGRRSAPTIWPTSHAYPSAPLSKITCKRSRTGWYTPAT
jgi:hypothetical protein